MNLTTAYNPETSAEVSVIVRKYIYENSPNWVGKIEKFTRLAMLIGYPLFYNIGIVIKTNHKDVNTYMN